MGLFDGLSTNARARGAHARPGALLLIEQIYSSNKARSVCRRERSEVSGDLKNLLSLERRRPLISKVLLQIRSSTPF